jgi:hypothetical protein
VVPFNSTVIASRDSGIAPSVQVPISQTCLLHRAQRKVKHKNWVATGSASALQLLQTFELALAKPVAHKLQNLTVTNN